MTSVALPDPQSPGFADSLAGELIQAGVLDPVGADRARAAQQLKAAPNSAVVR